MARVSKQNVRVKYPMFTSEFSHKFKQRRGRGEESTLIKSQEAAQTGDASCKYTVAVQSSTERSTGLEPSRQVHAVCW